MRLTLPILIAIALAAASDLAGAANRPSNPISSAKIAVLAVLKDPSSAQFRNIYISKKTDDVVCGEVNAKNSYGGYNGFKTFIVTLATKSVFILDRVGNPQEQVLALQAANACEFPLAW